MSGGSEGRRARIALELHAKQGVALESPATEILYGGSAGGGKSLLMRAAAVMWCGMIPGLQVYLFRRLRDDLVKNHIEGPQGLRLMLSPWARAGMVDIVEDEIRFWNGSKIYLCHCKDEKDRFKYLGSEIHVLCIDELTTFTDTIYRFLRSRVRMAGIKLPTEFDGKFPRILCGSNPGNIGHSWVKSAFIDARPPLAIERVSASDGGMLRQFIPARLADNPSVDPAEYTAKLEGLGSPALVKAMRDGDWNVVAGAFFPEFSTDQHVVTPRSLPAYWQRFRSFDWGSARPFSVGWYAVSDGELPEFPRGALIRYREWYGAQRDQNGATIPNTGLRLTAEEVADGILERERDDVYGNRVMGGVADPSIFAEDGGPSIADRMSARKVFFRPADNARVARAGAMGGWDQVRSRLKGDGERPAIYFFSTCLEIIRTLPVLQHDDGRPEDVQTEGEDHAADECLVGSTLIATSRGEIPIRSIRVDDTVLTRLGNRPVTAVFTNGEKDVFSVALSNGRSLTGTANHPVWVDGIGFTRLSDLRYGYRIGPCSLQSSVIPSKNLKDGDIISVDHTFSGAGSDCIAWFGSASTGAFHVGLISTIATWISRITTRRIWLAWAKMSTFPFMEGFALANPLPCSKNMLAHQQRNGMDLSRGSSGIGGITRRTAKKVFIAGLSKFVDIVANSSLAFIGRRGLIARTNASLRRGAKAGSTTSSATVLDAKAFSGPIATQESNIALYAVQIGADLRRRAKNALAIIVGSSFGPAVGRFGALTVVSEPMTAGRQKVFNLSVAEAEEYIANGALVHNCRYACASRPYTAPLPPSASEAEPDRYARRWKPGKSKGRGSAMAA